MNGKVDIKKALMQLTAHGINSVFVEAGATLAGKFHELNLIDNYILYLAPKIMGQDARGLFNVSELTKMTDVQSLQWQGIEQVGDDIRLTARKVAQKG
jgi:diaminohydroxyphosphoribosylaminopyrimidine deaminase/5-amino-6-(5-phosphoribosylamino)uracil reductase